MRVRWVLVSLAILAVAVVTVAQKYRTGGAQPQTEIEMLRTETHALRVQMQQMQEDISGMQRRLVKLESPTPRSPALRSDGVVQKVSLRSD